MDMETNVSTATERRYREATAAGLFYPAGAQSLRATLDDCLGAVREVAPAHARAIVVPHAGYRYSGPVAAHGYLSLGPQYRHIRRVVIVSAAHQRTGVDGVVAPAVGTFLTPLGGVAVDAAERARLQRELGVQVQDAPHLAEHGIEVQLPFLQRLLDAFTVVPLLVGGERGEALCEEIFRNALEHDDTVIVVSTDLSRYNDYEAGRSLDAHTRRAVERLASDEVQRCHACGFRPLRALLRVAASRGLRPYTLALRSSADYIGGDPRSAIGFGAFAFA